MDPTAQERLLKATGNAAAELRQQREEMERRSSDPPRPGDVFRFDDATDVNTEATLEWAAVGEREGQLLVVALDDGPAVGSQDVRLSLAGTVARCDVEKWLDTDLLVGRRSAVLGGDDLEQILEKRRRIAADILDPTPRERDVDQDPEYRRWRAQTLLPTRDTLGEPRPPAPPLSETRDRPRVRPERSPFRSRRLAVPLAVAASTVLAVKLSLTLQEVRKLREAVEQQQSHIAELMEPLVEDSQVNLPIVRLTPGETTRSGDGIVFSLRPETRRLAFNVDIRSPEYYEHYRLRILLEGRLVHTVDNLEKQQGSSLRFDLPAIFFEANRSYAFRVEGVNDGKGVLLDEYNVTIRR